MENFRAEIRRSSIARLYGKAVQSGSFSRLSKPKFSSVTLNPSGDDGERHEFITWLAANPLAGDVVPGSVGMRKVRWSRSGMGKRGGTRVIYYNTLSEGSIWLLIAYTKAKFDNLPAAFLKQLKEEISNGQ